jgi:hypothetical protein
MTAEERGLLEAGLQEKPGIFGDEPIGDFIGIPIISGLIIGGLGWFLGLLASFFVARRSATTIGTVAGLVAAAAITVTSAIRHRRRFAESLISQRQALDDGRMEELHCDVERAVRLEEQEDEGDTHFLQMGKGVILVLGGQHLAEIKPFPVERVILMRTAAGDGYESWNYCNVRTSGKRRRPVRVPKRLPRIRGRIPLFFRGNLDTLEEDLGRLTGKEPDLLEEILAGEGDPATKGGA